jgi:hypothetical protein
VLILKKRRPDADFKSVKKLQKSLTEKSNRQRTKIQNGVPKDETEIIPYLLQYAHNFFINFFETAFLPTSQYVLKYIKFSVKCCVCLHIQAEF